MEFSRHHIELQRADVGIALTQRVKILKWILQDSARHEHAEYGQFRKALTQSSFTTLEMFSCGQDVGHPRAKTDGHRDWSHQRRNAERTTVQEFCRPCQLRVAETIVEDEWFSALLECMSSLDERSGCIAGLYNHSRLGQRRHRRVTLGKEQSIAAPRPRMHHGASHIIQLANRGKNVAPNLRNGGQQPGSPLFGR
jgi:hypothetical protein